jgi:ABC-2 type transport system permease protein
MNWRAVRAIARKDLRVVRRSRALMLPLILVPLLIMVIVPLVLTRIPSWGLFGPDSTRDLMRILSSLPGPLRAQFASYTPEQAWIVVVNTQLLAPLMLIVPMMVASVIAADGFAGERERTTLEALLHSPVTDGELFVAKLLAAFVPAFLISLSGAMLYSVLVNVVAWPVMHRVFFPDTTWVVLIGWVAPACAVCGLAAVLLVSLRVRGTQEAMQITALLVLPIVALVLGQARGVVLLGVAFAVIAGAIVWTLAAMLILLAVRRFRRTTLIARV